MPPPMQWARAGLPLPAGMREGAFGAEGDWKQSRVSNSMVSVWNLCQMSSLSTSWQLLTAAGRHTANPTALLNVLGRALSSQLVGYKRQV